MQELDLLDMVTVILSLILAVLIPFITLLVRDIKKLLVMIAEAKRDDGKIDAIELEEILRQAGVIFKRIVSFYLADKSN